MEYDLLHIWDDSAVANALGWSENKKSGWECSLVIKHWVGMLSLDSVPSTSPLPEKPLLWSSVTKTVEVKRRILRTERGRNMADDMDQQPSSNICLFCFLQLLHKHCWSICKMIPTFNVSLLSSRLLDQVWWILVWTLQWPHNLSFFLWFCLLHPWKQSLQSYFYKTTNPIMLVLR